MPKSTPPTFSEPEDEEDEDDEYLTMTFADPLPKTETLVQKKKRLEREAETKSRTKSKAELAAEEKKKRDDALNTSLIVGGGETGDVVESKAFKMMQKLGYKPGMALGAPRVKDGEMASTATSAGDTVGADARLLVPIGVEMKVDRGGIGADAEKKRKIREEYEAQEEEVKKRKVDEGDFRERQQREREEKRLEGQVVGAQKVCERLEEEDEEEKAADEEDSVGKNRQTINGIKQSRITTKPLRSINVLWRAQIKTRLLAERDRRMRYDLHQSQTTRPTYDDPDEDEDDRIALGKKAETEEVALDLDEDDEELEEFEALPPAERLERIVKYLRGKWQYCFWCKFRYPDEEMEGCPGTTEDEHG